MLTRLSRNLLGDTSDVSPERAEENGSVEPVAPGLKTCIEIKGLRKVFPTPAGTKVAVSSLNLDMYEGQILALLGHNGAGEELTILFVCYQSFGWYLNICLAIVLTGCGFAI